MLFVASLVVLSACGPGVPQGEAVLAPRQRVNVLTSAELQRFQNAGEAIATLRPQWIGGRSSRSGARPSVFVDGVLTPGTEILTGLPLHQVREIRYLSRSEAIVRFGSGHRGGAIMVTTRL